MKNSFFVIFIAAAVLMMTASCAKIEDVDTTLPKQASFDAWMSKHINKNGVIIAQKQDNGMYIEFLADGDPGSVAVADTAVWIRLEYTGKTLAGDVFVTRNETEALKQRTYTHQTYYAPDYIFCGNKNIGMITGQFFALKQDKLEKPDGTTTQMREGSEVRLYMPSNLAFGSAGYSNGQGYGGQYKLSGSTAIIEVIKVKEVIKDPIKREETLVAAKALSWGLVEQHDTIAKFLYLDTLYRKNISAPFNPSQKLTADSTAKVWFVGRFLDESGFIFDTNIDSVYNRFYNRQPDYATKSKTHSALSYMADDNSFISAITKAIPAMRRGQWGRIVFTSVYGYGLKGLSAATQSQDEYNEYYMSMMMNSYSNSGYGNSYYDSYYQNNNSYNHSMSSQTKKSVVTEIHPYTPLVFEIYIEENE